jgi:prepilin-type N-terminal cleavage/methylation domain-containing protein
VSAVFSLPMMSSYYHTKRTNGQSGFTLLELLVVIAIIGVLASVVLASLAEARDKARDAVRASVAREMRNAMELYYSENDRYPVAHLENGNPVGDGWGSPIDSADADGILAATVRETGLSAFYPDEPRDPLGDPATDYGYVTDGTTGYALLLYLERDEDYCKVRVNAPSNVYGSVVDCVF